MTKKEIAVNFDLIVKEALSLILFCRDQEMQKGMADKLEIEAKHYISFKNQAHDNNDIVFSDTLFGFHNLLNSIKFCLKSILALKSGNPNLGWSYLIDAQEHLEFAALAKKYLYGIDGYYDQLKMMENILYPNFTIYHSPGLIEESGKCNICNKSIDQCDHLVGVLYNGIVCFEVDKKLVAMDHSSMVTNPKDRRCIITKISTDDGYMMDYFTLKKLDKIPEEKLKNGSIMLTEGIIIHSNNLEIN